MMPAHATTVRSHANAYNNSHAKTNMDGSPGTARLVFVVLLIDGGFHRPHPVKVALLWVAIDKLILLLHSYVCLYPIDNAPVYYQVVGMQHVPISRRKELLCVASGGVECITASHRTSCVCRVDEDQNRKTGLEQKNSLIRLQYSSTVGGIEQSGSQFTNNIVMCHMVCKYTKKWNSEINLRVMVSVQGSSDVCVCSPTIYAIFDQPVYNNYQIMIVYPPYNNYKQSGRNIMYFDSRCGLQFSRKYIKISKQKRL